MGRGGWQLNLNILIRCLEQLEDSPLSLFKSAFNRICGFMLVRDYLSVPFSPFGRGGEFSKRIDHIMPQLAAWVSSYLWQ